jgi:hypothetical protein
MTLSGCSSSGGGPSSSGTATPITPADDGIGTRLVVSGQLLGVGGPAPGAPRSWPGSVSWTGPTHGTVRVHSDGRFALSLPPGRYELTGHSPRYGDSDYLCRAAHPVVVGTHGPLRVDVWCQLM